MIPCHQNQDIVNIDLHLTDQFHLELNAVVDVLLVPVVLGAELLVEVYIHTLIRPCYIDQIQYCGMEDTSEEDVYPPQRIFPTLDFWLTYRENRLSRKKQFLRWKHLV